MQDKINPEHYPKEYDLIWFCNLHSVPFSEGNVMKYVLRHRNKNGLEDLLKAKEYLNRLIEEYSKD